MGIADRISQLLSFLWGNSMVSISIVMILSLVGYFSVRKTKLIPDRLQSAVEIFAGGLDDFLEGILGAKGRRFTPFIGTLFIYILLMNLAGLIPFVKSPTVSWSNTLALGICVFVYVQYTGIRELGLLGYLDHLAGKPRGGFAFTLILPAFMVSLHMIAELVRPISLSLRLRSNIWGDDMLIGILAGFGFKGLLLLLLNMMTAVLTSVVQAGVFCLLTTVYISLVLNHEEENVLKRRV